MSDTINVGIGISLEKEVAKAVREAVQQAKELSYKEKFDLAILFSSVDFAYPNTLRLITNLLGPLPIIGCSGAALISNKGIFRKALGIMLLSFPQTIHFNIGLVKDIRAKTALSAGGELGEKLLHGFSGTKRDLGVIFSDGLLENSSNLIYGVQEKLGTSFPLIGACASDNFQFSKTYVYCNQEATDNAACGILFGGKLNFGWGVQHGWKPLGKLRCVTKAKENIVYEIDDCPAAKIYEEYLAHDLNELKKDLKRISIFYPIGINIPGEDEYLLRNVHAIGNDESLIFQASVPEGSLIRLMIGTKESCLTATRHALYEVKKSLPGKKINFVFVFESISRSILLGRNAYRELEIIKEEIGNDTPIIGIYTYGEQTPLRAICYHGKTYFHNQTIAILGIE